jgi:hypothetical protein
MIPRRAELRDQCMTVSRKRLAHLMRKACPKGVSRRHECLAITNSISTLEHLIASPRNYCPHFSYSSCCSRDLTILPETAHAPTLTR